MKSVAKFTARTRKSVGEVRLEQKEFDIPRLAAASRPAPKNIYKPELHLTYISVLPKSGSGRDT